MNLRQRIANKKRLHRRHIAFKERQKQEDDKVFDLIKAGLLDSIEYTRGKLRLVKEARCQHSTG